jgi:hypothetical protein
VVSEEIQLNLVAGNGPLFNVEQIIGENTKQLLVLSNAQIVPPPAVTPYKPSNVNVPAQENVIGSQQILLQNSLPLSVQAIKVKEIEPIVADLSFQVVVDGVMVNGSVNKNIVFVGTDNVVRSISEQTPFSIMVKIPGVSQTQILNSKVEIEDIIFNLDVVGNMVNQTLVLKAKVIGQEILRENSPVITYLTGPGISKNITIVRSNR